MENKELDNIGYDILFTILNEKQKRILVARDVICFNMSISDASRKSGLSRMTIYEGIKEIKNGKILESKRIREQGGGRKKLELDNPEIKNKINSLIEPTESGSPESLLRWTCKSTRNIAEFLNKSGLDISHNKVGELLHEMGYSLRGNLKDKEGKSSHQDRDKQFKYINNKANLFRKEGNPIISVDTKKKELIGEFKNNGKEWVTKKQVRKVKDHDFGKDKAIPYGIYDVINNKGFVNVGMDNDTSEFAVESIRKWYNKMGKKEYPNSKKLLICADGGGSNGYRVKLWKSELQKLANETDLEINVCHYPPGTSKWNKIEHKLFSFITMNWRANPLTSYEVIVSLINKTKTKSGLTVKSELDTKKYAKGKKVSKEELEAINIKTGRFHKEWNYKICPSN